MMDKNGILHSDFEGIGVQKENLWQILYPHLKKWKNLTATIVAETNERIMFSEALIKALRWGKELKKHFVGHVAPVVSILLPNTIDYLPLVWGCLAVGAPICPIRADISLEIFNMMIDQTKPRVMILEELTFNKFQQSIGESGIDSIIYINGNCKNVKNSIKSLKEVLNSGEMLELHEAGNYCPEDVALIAYSSGTTGNPKGILMTHQAIVTSIKSFQSMAPDINLELPDGKLQQQTAICNFEMSGSMGVKYYTIASLLRGLRTISISSDDALLHLEFIKKYKATVLMSRNPVVEKLSDMDCGDAIDSLRIVSFLGSVPNYNAFRKLNEKTGGRLLLQDKYGTTECTAVAITTREAHRFGMTGKLVPNYTARFVDLETGQNIAKPNTIGELQVRGVGIMKGYLNNEEATRAAIDADGWYHTGDVAYFDEDYFIKVVERFVDLITVYRDNQKMKVSPSEIEAIIMQHPMVYDCGVIGAPEPSTGGENPRAYVIRKEGLNGDDHIQKESLSGDDIIKFVEAKAPREMRLTGGVFFVQKLPRNHMGKMVRKYLKKMSWYPECT